MRPDFEATPLKFLVLWDFRNEQLCFETSHFGTLRLCFGGLFDAPK